MERMDEVVPLIRARTGLNVAASLGILTVEQARRLAAAGVHRYNHNLETARSFFGRVVTTHTWKERFDTCRLVRDAGMELCCGALLGMGETDEQRLERSTS
jgi:biotin synthase